VHRDAADVVAANLALAGVQPGTHLDAERLHRVADRHRATDRSLRTVEHRDETVAGGVDLAASKPSELRPDDRVVLHLQRLLLTSVSLKCSSASRYHHRLKTFHGGPGPGWRDEQLADGTIVRSWNGFIA
jgi:hypothetical protein